MPSEAAAVLHPPAMKVIDLGVESLGPDGRALHLVAGISWSVQPGEVLGIVGESGSGKTLSTLATVGLLPRGSVRLCSGEVRISGRTLDLSSDRHLLSVRGREVGVIFQDAMAALNPLLSIGNQIVEAIRIHQPHTSKRDARTAAVGLLSAVGIPRSADWLKQYPHQLSGGMRQRCMIAMAIANSPSVLIADEPTTALDVTIQAQVMEVLAAAQAMTGAAMILISHDLRLVAEWADQVVVMYAGRIVESGPAATVLKEPRHPYTAALLASAPKLGDRKRRLAAIPGTPPAPGQMPSGCRYEPRCWLGRGRDLCAETEPPLEDVLGGHETRCHYWHELKSTSRPDLGQVQHR